MKRHGISKAQYASVALVLALVALGSVVILSSANKSTQSSSSASQPSVTPSLTTAPPTSVTAISTSTTAGHSSTSSPTTTASSSSSTSSASSTAAHISHVIVLLMENEEYGNVIGNQSAPYETALAKNYSLAANYYAVAHPSLPNYLALVAGSTFGVTTDCAPTVCSLPANVTTIASLLDSHGLSWKEYAESMPTECSQANSGDGQYVTKHDPFVYFGSITGNNGTGSTSSYCDSHVVTLTQFYSDLSARALPNYSFVTPNICDDAHSCSLQTGDQWLSAFVPKIIGSSSFASTALFIVYDEGASNDSTGGGGHVPCILVSPFAKSGYVSEVQYSHYSLLATVETIFNLGSLGRNDNSAVPMSDLFASGL